MPQCETDKDSLIGSTTCVTIGDSDNADNADDVEDYQNTARQKVCIIRILSDKKAACCQLLQKKPLQADQPWPSTFNNDYH